MNNITMDNNNSLQHPRDVETTKHQGKIAHALNQARRDLVDPSRRNRLLHAPLAGKRPWCMPIFGEDPDDIFNALYRQENFRGYAFNPNDNAEQLEKGDAKENHLSLAQNYNLIGNDTAPSGRRPAGRPRLQTLLSAEKLERRLTKIFRDERTLNEEQGISTLFLAIGFLRWFDSDQSEEPSFAPLILLPVTINRVRGRDGYLLMARDDEIVVNVSLREKLKSDFNITLPDIPEDESWKPSDYCQSVEREIGRLRRWQVEPNSIGLGFFTFSKTGAG